ncbi:hypothetical protein P2H89_18910 [Paraflavitalea sp. CAU 1676]|nr:hypothetical protein [Paraflavitalea sp. CAU 1676]
MGDIHQIDGKLLWQLFQKGKAEIYINLDDHLFWYNRLTNKKNKAPGETILKTEFETHRVVLTPLNSPGDFLQFSIQYKREYELTKGYIKPGLLRQVQIALGDRLFS